jgi:hypothetical protein
MRLIYFAPVPWDSYEQRPHYFARHVMDRGGRVLWIDPYPARLPALADVWQWRDRAARMPLARPDRLDVLGVRALPIDPLPGGVALNRHLFWKTVLDRLRAFAPNGSAVLGIGRPTSLAAAALDACRPAWSFYDAMDDFPQFYSGRSRRATAAVEHAIARRVTRVFTSSSALTAKFARVAHDVTHVPNAYDMSLLPAPAERMAGPARIGFIGCLGGWFDWSLVTAIAAHVTPAPVTLVGPVATRPPARMPANVEIQPPCHQPAAVRWLDQFTIGLIPFRQTPLTAAIDPVKYYQYRGAGLPILSSRFGEMSQRGPAEATFFADAGAPGRAIDLALAYRASPEAVVRFREENTWTRRFTQLDVFDP